MQQPFVRVAIIGTNDPQNVSGGRYHGLILAYAIAALAGEAHVVSDHLPSFIPDLEPLAPNRVHFHRTPDFASGLPAGPFDWVLIVPTGIFLPEFYENCLDFAANSGARIGLVNFETADWFNSVSNNPRDPALWDYWRRVCLRGGLVLSSTRTSHRFAARFYCATEGCLRFEVWSPPINSAAARRMDDVAKDGSILAFVRPQDTHKGSAGLTQIDPALFSGRTLRLVSGRDIPAAFETAMRDHLARANGARLELFTRIPDLQKFHLLTAAQAVLFPSRFEGFGYPPVEAAYAGTESVCFRLPVLEETVGRIANFADGGTMPDFSDALRRALAQPERRTVLREAVMPIADFDIAAGRLADILLRSADVVSPLRRVAWRAPIGPWAMTEPRPFRLEDDAILPPLPAHVRSVRRSTGGDILISAVAFFRPGLDGIEAVNPAGSALPVRWVASSPSGGFMKVSLHVLAPRGLERRRITIRAVRDGTPWGEPILIQLDSIEAGAAALPIRCGISENSVAGSQRMLRGWVLTAEPLEELHFSPDGDRWFCVSGFTERQDVFSKYPGYASPRCEFRIHVPPDAAPDPQAARLLCLSGGKAFDWLAGWPPVPKAVLEPSVASEPQPGSVSAAWAIPRVKRAAAGTLEVLDVTDAAWSRGIARDGDIGRLGAVSLRVPGDVAGMLRPGMVLGFATGAARRITRVETGNGMAVAVLNAPLHVADNGYPGTVGLYEAEDPPSGRTERSFSLTRWSDERWFHSIWNCPDERFRRMFFMRQEAAARLGVAPGARLDFAVSGERTVLTTALHDRDVQVLLDGPIRPMADGPPAVVEVLDPAPATVAGALRFSLAPQTEDHVAGTQPGGHGTCILLEPSAADRLAAGGLLRFSDGTISRIQSVAMRPNGYELCLASVPGSVRQGRPGVVVPVDEIDAPDGPIPLLQSPGAALVARDPLYRALAEAFRATGDVLLPVVRPVPGRVARVLFITIVPPVPATQGNRVVTRNLVRHLLDLGLEVDLVLQGWTDTIGALEEFDERVRIFAVPSPRWEESDGAQDRTAIRAAAQRFRSRGLDGSAAALLEEAAVLYHPHFIIRDETVEIARSLFARHHYASIVCNYTHCLRVVEELARMAALPPVCVVTHDALSRLPRSFQGQNLDTTYRACLPAVERDVLNAIKGAVVVAISRSEARYFQEIGVTNPVVLCEYDAAEEMAGAVVSEANFSRRRIIFNGSANPMNVAGLNWFVDECWPDIAAAVPDIKLLVCGRIGTHWNPGLPGIEVTGELDRDAMVRLCGDASVAINPCVAGTGLKIKTVEACCLGLPAVCLPAAVDGLEDVADRFAIVAESPAAFTRACIALLTDQDRWTALHASSLEVARQRFSAQTVYQALDAALGWQQVGHNNALRPGPADSRPLDDHPIAAGRHRDEPAALGAEALNTGEYWAAVLHGATIVGSYPDKADGYALIAAGLERLGRHEHALACLSDGALACGADLLARLETLLRQLGREGEAGRVAALQPPRLAVGNALPLDAVRLARRARPGWTVDADGLIWFQSGKAALLFFVAPAPAGVLTVSVDLSVPPILEPIPFRLTLNGRAEERQLEQGQTFQSFRMQGPMPRLINTACRLELTLPPGLRTAVPITARALVVLSASHA